MRYVKREKTRVKINSPGCTVHEYDAKDRHLDIAVVELTGRYPLKGWAENQKCTEGGYVVKGSGKCVTEQEEVLLEAGDLVILEPQERYYWEGQMTLVLSTTPPWTADQHLHHEDLAIN